MGTDYRERRAEVERKSRNVRIAVSCVIALVVFAALTALALWASAPADLSGGEQGDATSAGQQSWQPRASQSDATVEVVDSVGRSVSVPQDPVSIAVFDSFSGEFAVMVGAGDKLCGVPAGVKSDVILCEICPRLSSSIENGGMLSLSGSSINIESVLQAQCDLAIVKSTMSDAECTKLDSANIPYVKVGYTDIAEQMLAMNIVGRACGDEAFEKSQGFVSFYEGVLEDVEARATGIAPENRVSVYHSINSTLLTDAKGSLGADWIEAVGCTDVSSSMSASSATDFQATPEQIYDWDADVVIANTSAAVSEFKSDSKWEGLRAVRDGEVYVIPTGATRWGQRGSVETYLAMLWLGCIVYPQAYADVDLRQTVCDYYAKYLGIDVRDSLWEEMLSGEGLRSAGTGNNGVE